MTLTQQDTKTRTGIRLPEWLYRKLRITAIEQGTTASGLATVVLTEHFAGPSSEHKNTTKRPRKQQLEETVNAAQ
jgi:hypothetical protein